MSGGYTLVEYNTVQIANCQTHEFREEWVKDASGLTTIHRQFTVRVSGYFLAQQDAQTQILPNKGALAPAYEQTAGSQLVQIRELLGTPRKDFKMTFGFGGTAPTVVLEAKAPSGSGQDMTDPKVDVAGGPIPKVLSVDHVASNQAIKIQFEIVVCLPVSCSESSSSGDTQARKGILSNRWSCADTIDENYYTGRTFVGELRLANPLVNPHDFRAIVVPPIQPGMMFGKMDFKASEDGLKLNYTVEHKEATVTAPSPATGVKIQHRITQNENATEIAETLSITLRGSRNVNKRQLAILASLIADGKIRKDELIPPVGINPAHRLIKEEWVDECGSDTVNQISVIYHMLHAPTAGENILNGNTKLNLTRRFGKKIDGSMIADYDNTKSFGNRPGESTPYKGILDLAGAFSSHLQSYCTTDHSANRGIVANFPDQTLVDSTAPRPPLPAVDLEVFPDVPDLPDSTYSQTHYQGLYQTYEIDSQYEEDTMILQAPLSSPITSGGSLSDLLNGGGSSGGSTPTTPTNPYPTATPTTGNGTAVSGDSSVFLQIGPAQWRRVIRVTAKRNGWPPRLPNPLKTFRDEDGVLHVLTEKTLVGCEPSRLPDGSRDFILRAEYKYGMSRPPQRIRLGEPDYEGPTSLGSPSIYSYSVATIFGSDKRIG